MASKYWIKLYHEILHDPKMGRLPDGVWRRAVEMFLLAGELGDDGKLPPIADMAWTLRLDEGVLRKDLEALVKAEIVTETDGQWIVTHFAKRQAPVPGAERLRQFRESQRKGQYYDKDSNESVTDIVTNRYVEPDTESDRDEETDHFEAPKALSSSPSSLDSILPGRTSIELEDRIELWSNKFDDAQHIESNLTQAFNLWGKYPNMSAQAMIRAVNVAAQVTERRKDIKNRMGYFFIVLAKNLEPH